MSQTAEAIYTPVTGTLEYGRARIEGPGIFYNQVRFVFSEGNVAVWVVERKTASRIHLFSGATLSTSDRRKVPDVLTLPDSTQWLIRYLGEDCGCRRSPLAGKEASDLLDPDFHTASL